VFDHLLFRRDDARSLPALQFEILKTEPARTHPERTVE